MGKKREIKFKVGDWVRVNREIVMVYDEDNNRNIEIVDLGNHTKEGQIVGGTIKRCGNILKHHIHGNEYEHEFVHKKSHFVYLIRNGFINKPIMAFEEDIEYAVVEINKKLPYVYQDRLYASEHEREIMREAMKERKRDEKGRWLPSNS